MKEKRQKKHFVVCDKISILKSYLIIFFILEQKKLYIIESF